MAVFLGADAAATAAGQICSTVRGHSAARSEMRVEIARYPTPIASKRINHRC
jgi:hypothetical protein